MDEQHEIEQVERHVQLQFRQMMAVSRSLQSLLLEKFQPEHISATLKIAAAEGERESKFRTQVFGGSLVVGPIAFLAMCALFLHYGKPELLEKLLGPLVAVIIVAAGGYSVGRYQGSKDE